jgi:hypothetical protein
LQFSGSSAFPTELRIARDALSQPQKNSPQFSTCHAQHFTFPAQQHNFHSIPLGAPRLQIPRRYRIMAFLQIA